MLAVRTGLAKSGDFIAVTAGIPTGVPGSTNMIKVQRIELYSRERLRYNPGETLEFTALGTAAVHANECWSQPDDLGMWTFGARSTLTLLPSEPVDCRAQATFTINDVAVNARHPTQTVRVLLDGAQTVPHNIIDVQDLDVDFLAFSMHKMCGPRGVGVLYSKKELLGRVPHEEDGSAGVIEPVFLGGGTVADVTYKDYSLLEPPERFEAGIQNYPGQIASAAAINYLQHIGMERITAHEKRLNSFLTAELTNRYGNTDWFKILGPRDAAQRGSILTFVVQRPNAVGIAAELSEKNNIMIRDGVFCAHAYFNEQFGQGWTRPRLHSEHRMVYRVSFYFYNTIEECHIFLETLDEIFRARSYI